MKAKGKVLTKAKDVNRVICKACNDTGTNSKGQPCICIKVAATKPCVKIGSDGKAITLI